MARLVALSRVRLLPAATNDPLLPAAGDDPLLPAAADVGDVICKRRTSKALSLWLVTLWRDSVRLLPAATDDPLLPAAGDEPLLPAACDVGDAICKRRKSKALSSVSWLCGDLEKRLVAVWSSLLLFGESRGSTELSVALWSSLLLCGECCGSVKLFFLLSDEAVGEEKARSH